VTERVVPVEIGTRWNPNVPDARLLVHDDGETRLLLRPHVDDADQRSVMLVWHSSRASSMEPPNDEARSGHRLYDSGLREVRWLGEVHESALIDDLERRNRVHDRHNPARYRELHHWIVPLKECTVEVVARSLEVERRAR
jgi:hypothetical protein